MTSAGQPRTVLFMLGLVSGALDVISFLHLGGVFTSVMTSNLVFMAAAAVRTDGSLAIHAAVALGGFAVGAGIGERVGGWPGGRLARSGRTIVFGGELSLLAAVASAWVAAGARPRGTGQLLLLVAVAVAMGAQSAVSRHLPGSSVSTTYLTGMLTGVFAAVGSPPGRRRVDPSTAAVVAGVVTGAALSAGLLLWVPRLAPWAAVTALAIATVLARPRA